MNIYRLWPIQVRRNIKALGINKGKSYFRFGLGARWEEKRLDTKRILGWSFFVVFHRLVFGRKVS